MAALAALATGAALAVSISSPPAAQAAEVGEDLVVNGGFEATAVTPWVGRGGGQALARTTEDKVSGDAALAVTGRTSSVTGPQQRLAVESGATYDVSFKVKYTDPASSSPVTFNGTVDYGSNVGGEQYVVLLSRSVPKGEWTEVSGEVVVPAGRDLSGYQFYIENTYNLPTGAYPTSFLVDDVSFVKTAEGDGTDPEPEPVVDQLERNDNTAPGSFGAFAKTPGTDAASRRGNPLVTQNFGADPWAMEVDGRVYVYTTNDTQEWPEHLATGEANNYGSINQVNVWSSADMVNWTNHGSINAAGVEGIARDATGAPGNSWAPAAASRDVDGDGEEEFFLYFANSAGGIWVLQGESPTGPFTSPLDRSLVGFDTPGVRGNSDPDATDVVWLFDPAVLVDDDGQAYLYFGGGVPTTGGGADDPDTARVIKLGDDMTSVEGEATLINAPGIFEDSGIHKVGDTYYYTYCTNFSHNVPGLGRGDIVVMQSQDPMGPWSAPRLVFPNQQRFFGQGTGGNNHHAFFSFGDDWYLTYHAPTLDAAIQGPANAAGFRNAHIEPVTLNADGSVQEVVGTYAGPGQLATLDPYAAPVSAETIAWQAGTRQGYAGTSTFEGQTPTPILTSVHDDDWTSLAGVDLGTDGAASITARVRPEAGGTITMSTSPDPASTDRVVGTLAVPAGDGTTWTDLTAELPAGALTGVQDLFFRYAGDPEATDEGELFDVETWTFAPAGEDPTEPAEPQPTTVSAGPASVVYGQAGSLPVRVAGATGGTVAATVGGREVRAAVDARGRATLVLPARSLAPGRTTVTVRYLGTTTSAPSSGAARVDVRKARARLVVRLRDQVRAGKVLVVRVQAAATGVVPTGTVRVRLAGGRAVTKALRQGRATVRVAVRPRADDGRTRVVVTYPGDRYVDRRSVTRSVRVVRR
ncbi:family 43 glycosylhydrolase [Nocardioides litoris]|uniref:family 43 glycosylhydrolase n=1 Tax=Nocardioides litoris TaxID=1926648 RepID=UPI001476C32C|nr:family 43 glycosylhydrolase [Nocardioides litoris]